MLVRHPEGEARRIFKVAYDFEVISELGDSSLRSE